MKTTMPVCSVTLRFPEKTLTQVLASMSGWRGFCFLLFSLVTLARSPETVAEEVNTGNGWEGWV